MKKYFLLLLTAFLFLRCTKSVEELKLQSDKLFDQAMDYYERGYLKQSSELFREVVEIESKLGGVQRRANSYVYLGLIYYHLADFSQSMDFYQKALYDFRNLNDKRSELLVLNNIAGIHSLLGEYDEAIEIYSNVIGKSLIFADKESEAIASLNLGDVYLEMFDYDKAFDYFNRAFDAYEILGDVKGKIFTLNKIGELFISSKNFPNAIKSFDMAFEIQNKNGINYLSQQLYNNIGLIYFKENQIQKAKEFFETALNLKSASETDQLILIAIRNNLGDCESQSGSYSKAIEYYNEALALSEQSFLKFLSPVIQLKIAKSFEKLYFINHNDADKKSAERFYQFAVNRFEEIRDEENLFKALTLISSFYVRVNERKKAAKYFDRMEDLKINLSLKSDENLRVFALNPDFDISFLEFFIDKKDFEKAYRIIHLRKIKSGIEYFLRFHNFNFLDKSSQEIFQNLKNEVFALNTYQQIFKQELALPSPQRIKEKLQTAEKIFDEKTKLVDDYLKKLSDKYLFLQPIISQTKFENLVKEDGKVFVEYYPADENLFYFLIGKKGVYAKSLKSDLASLKFNSRILVKNIDEFSYKEIIDFSKDNLSWLIDDLLKEIDQKFPATKEINFLLNGLELDFIPHLIFSKKLNGFLKDEYFVSYSYIFYPRTESDLLKSFGVLKNGQVVELQNMENKNRSTQVLKEKTSLKKPELRIGLRENLTSPKVDSISIKKNIDAIFILDNILMNEASPELIYFQNLNKRLMKTTKVSQKFSLREIFRFHPKLIFLNGFNLKEHQSYLEFFSLIEFVDLEKIIFPIIDQGQELSENFLYNYKERAENKNLKEASSIFWKMISENQKESLKNSFNWISFTK